MKNLLHKIIVLFFLIQAFMLVSCNTGSTIEAQKASSLNLASFVVADNHTNSNLQSMVAPQFYMNFTANAALGSIQLALYGDNACANVYGIYTAGYGYTYLKNIYHTSDQSSFILCNSIAGGGCSTEFSRVKSFKYFYNFANGSQFVGNCTVSAIQNSTATACSSSSNCGILSKTTDVITPPTAALNNYMYLANFYQNTITQYLLDSSTGNLSVPSQQSTGTLNGPTGLFFYNGYVFITQWNNGGTTNVMSKCNVASGTGTLSSCVDAGATNLNGPKDMELINGVLYIVNYTGASVTKCNISSAGVLSSCAIVTLSGTNTVLFGPNGIEYKNGYVYITNQSKNNVVKCSINTSGNFISCVDSGATGLNTPTQTLISNGFAYITNADNVTTFTVSKCNVDNSTGLFSGCVDAGATNSANPEAIDIINGYVYISSVKNSLMTKCSVDLTLGNFTGCASLSGSFGSPSEIRQLGSLL